MDEHDPRPFQAIRIEMASSEQGIDRFMEDRIFSPPDTAAWRCNLTAMSQRYNLYFIAQRSGIAVYTPDFPFQKLNKKPKLFIPPTLAEPNAPGYIDQRDPHAINNLIVGDLGTEEILLLATDSGNVTAYHTTAIKEAIERDPYRFSKEGRSDTVGLRAFWSQWVRESAWGLALHTEARMIAVSANVPHVRRVTVVEPTVTDSTATITVFAFALTEDTQDESGESQFIDDDMGFNEGEWANWDPAGSTSKKISRSRNYRIVLRGETGHRSNIPSVSFVNTRQDTQGIWLLSTDISGVMKLWQIWSGVCRSTWNFGSDAANSVFGYLDEEAGWMVAALDPGAFRPTETMAQFCGHSSAPKHLEKGSETYDISRIVRLTVPGRSHRHPLVHAGHDDADTSDESSASSSDEEAEETADHFSDDEDTSEGNALSLQNPAALLNHQSRTHVLPTASEPDADSNARESLSEAERLRAPPHETRDIEDILLDVYQSGLEDSEEDFSNDSDVGNPVQVEDDEDSEGNEARSTSSASFASETSLSHVTQRSSVDVEIEPLTLASPGSRSPPPESNEAVQAKKRRRKGIDSTENEIVLPDIPTLHCTTSHLRLINVPKARLPYLFCANILHQRLPSFWRGEGNALRRLNMLQQIPELGIIVIASQSGRCAVCALTRHPQTGSYGLRVDWTLPTKRQEKSGQRPGFWLLGIATAPVQGHLLDSEAQAPPEQAWGEDQEIDGTHVSFDPGVVALPDREEHPDEADTDDATHRASKRFRRGSTASTTSSSGVSTIQRPWKRPNSMSFYRRSHENRRYRLMLTYADHTVLTYELSRNIGPENDSSVVIDA